MKHLLLLSAILLATLSACSTPAEETEADTLPQIQDRHRHGNPIKKIVKDLSDDQVRRLDSIMGADHDYIDSLRWRQRALSDSISRINDLYGDHSQQIFPLYEQEADLQKALNQAFYRNKMKMDSVLTQEQFNVLNAQMKNHHQDRDHRDRSGRHHGSHPDHGFHHGRPDGHHEHHHPDHEMQ